MGKSRYILGITYGGHDTSSALMVNGELIAACEQERYSLDKHSRKFPHEAIADCLDIGGIDMDTVTAIAFTLDPYRYVKETYLRPAMESADRIQNIVADINRIEKFLNTENRIREITGFKGIFHFNSHHLCHLASSYYPSGFNNALLVSLDGLGEVEAGFLGVGVDGEISVLDTSNRYPDSLGLIYSAITYYLGWKHHCDEGIIMGLAPFGDPKAKIPGSKRSYYSIFEEIVQVTGPYSYKINKEWIAYHEVRDKWVSDKFLHLMGPKRCHSDKISQHHKNIAAALQKRLEDVVLSQLRIARKDHGMSKLCLSGGVALNCSMNGKIESAKIFDEIFVQPASGDSGLAIGGCYITEKKLGGRLKPKWQRNFYLGSRYSDVSIQDAIEEVGMRVEKASNIFQLTAKHLVDGKIVGWFQGAAEFGPRALGNRSILCRPYPESMRDHLNSRVKFREEFRPFAPAILAEKTDEFFQIGQESPHMLIACDVKEDKRDTIPAVVHVDNSCRVQTVDKINNPRFRKLIEEFYSITNIPVLLNTSFNVKGEPIVNNPRQAVKCFLSTNIDFLAMGDFFLTKQ